MSRQNAIVKMVLDGFSRKAVAAHFGTSTDAISQAMYYHRNGRKSRKLANPKKRGPRPDTSVPEGKRRCSSCREIKDLGTEFYTAPTGKDGYHHVCKSCNRVHRVKTSHRVAFRKDPEAFIHRIDEHMKLLRWMLEAIELETAKLVEPGPEGP